MSLVTTVLSISRRITIVIAIAIAFLFGVVSTVYLSLRSPEVNVPDVVGKDRFDAEKILADADLNFRVRATRPSNQAKPDTVLFQLPRPGEVVKAGQTVAMDISRAAKEGETPETVKPAEEPAQDKNTSSNTNENENKPKRTRNANNSNQNSNGNLNSNRTGNINRPVNANRNANSVIDNANATPRVNVNRGDEHNSNSPINNQNENRRPVTVRPSPAPTRTPRQ